MCDAFVDSFFFGVHWGPTVTRLKCTSVHPFRRTSGGAVVRSSSVVRPVRPSEHEGLWCRVASEPWRPFCGARAPSLLAQRPSWDATWCRGSAPAEGVMCVYVCLRVAETVTTLVRFWFSSSDSFHSRLASPRRTHEQISLGGYYPFGSSVDPYFDLGNPGAISYPLAWFHKSVRRGSRSANN